VKTEAAILWRPGEPIEIAEIDVAPPRAGEVLVKIAACGVCASDLHVVDGDLPEPLPLVLGHEASGVITEVGPGVESLAPGDPVVLALVPSCGECAECRRGRSNFCEAGARMAASGTLADGTSRLSRAGTTLHHFNSVSSFATHAVVPESVAVKIRPDVPLVQATPDDDVVAAVKDVTAGGPDYVFEAIGEEETIQQAWTAAGPRGTVVVVGVLPKGSTLTIDPWQFFQEKTLKGSFLGSADVRADVPRLVDLYAAGDLELDALVERRIPLAELPAALERLRAGDGLRQLVVFA
jgi:S-(hydroxymethyl)glutathione dehydrogenase/alcohol dehydrogenase